MRSLSLDVRLAIRKLRRASTFTLFTVSLLAIGIGGATAVFSVLNVIYYRPLPYPNGDRLAVLRVSLQTPACGGRCQRDPNRAEVRAWTQEASLVDEIGSISPMQAVVRSAAGGRLLEGAEVTAGILRLLTPRAVLGRSLTPSDFAPAAPRVVVLSHSGWIATFGGDSSVLGSPLRLNDVSYTIVGVLNATSELGPPLFSLNVTAAQFWTARDASRSAGSSVNRTIARVRQGATLDAVRRQLDVLLAREGAGATWAATVQSLRDAVASRYRGSFWYLLGAVALLLGVACLNVGGLFLARLHDRAPELATRVALGGTRWDIVRYVLVEASLIGLAGGIGGSVLAIYGVTAARLLPAGRLPVWATVSLDWRVLAAALALSIASTVAIAVVPLAAFGPERLLARLRERASVSTGRSRARAAFVSAQVALSLVLLTGAGALATVLLRAELRDTGMTKHSLIYVLLRPPANANIVAPHFASRLVEQLRRTPGVVAAAATGDERGAAENGPASLDGGSTAMVAAGTGASFSSAIAPRMASDVTPGYFATMGITILQGRAFGPADVAGAAPVAILDQPTAQHLFPDGSALGRRIKFGDATSTAPWMTIVGIAAPVLASPLDADPRYRPRLYRSMAQFPTFPTSVLVKVSGASAPSASALRRAVAAVDPSAVVADVISVEQSLGARLWEARFNAVVIGAFAVVALFLACFGVYAAVSYLVTARQRELALRIALGAGDQEIVRLMVRSGVAMLVPGLVLGLAASFVVGRLLRSLLYGAHVFEPYVLLAAVVALAVTSLLATWLPARRASGIEPGTLLRSL